MGSSLSSVSRQRTRDGRLHAAIEEARIDKAIRAIAKGARIDQLTLPRGRRPTRDPRILTLSSVEPPAWSALMHACFLGHQGIVQVLLQQGADIAFRAADGTTPLMLAAQEGHVHVVQELLRHTRMREAGGVGAPQIPPLLPPSGPNAVILQESVGGASPAPLLASFSSFVTGDALPPVAPRSASSFDLVLDAIDDFGQTALLKSAALGFSAIIELLVYAGANVCVADRAGMTALAWAAESGPAEIVLLLIQAGANINRKNNTGQTPLLCAASRNYNYYASGESNSRPVQSGAHDDVTHDGDLEESKSVVPNGPSWSASSASSSSSRPWGSAGASSSSPSSVVLMLLSHGADKDSRNHDHYCALHVAAYKGHQEVVELLLAFKANLNARAEKGQTALGLAAAGHHFRIAQLLIAAGAQLDIVDERGESALHKASLAGDRFTAECLLDAGANLHLKEYVHGDSALMLAARQMHSSGIVLLLLQRGAPPNECNHRGESALLLASARGHTYTAGVLIRYGASVTSADIAGNTSLLLAARVGSDSVVELLLDVAAPMESNHAGLAPLDAALTGGSSHAAVVELLVAAGADPAIACARLHSHVGSGGSSDVVTSVATLPVPLRDAIDRGLTNRERYERRERRYADIIAAVRAREAAAAVASLPATSLSSEAAATSSSTLRQFPSSHNSVSITRHTSDLGQVTSLLPSSASSSSIRRWDVPHVLSWLQSLGLPQYVATFSEASVDGEMLLELLNAEGEELLRHELGVEHRLHRMKIMREITKLQSAADSALPDRDDRQSIVAALAAASSSVPLTTSISNPLPTSYSPGHIGSLRPMTEVNSVTAATAPPTGLDMIAPPEKVASESDLQSLVAAIPPQTNGGLSIFSLDFDFNNLSSLAPLSSTSSSSSSKDTLPSSVATSTLASRVITPSGSGEAIPLVHRPPTHRPTNSSTEYAPVEHWEAVPRANGSLALTPQVTPVASSALPVTQQGAPRDEATLAAVESRGHGGAVSRRIPFSELVFKSVIGQGQFGTVWLGTWRGTPVAIKKLHQQTEALATGPLSSTHARDSSLQLQLLQEIALMELLGNHPNLLTLVGICLPDTDSNSAAAGSVFIVTQYFPLGSVRDLLITRKTQHKVPPAVLATVATVTPANSSGAPPLVSWSLAILLRFCRDIACGILHLHLDHVIHRDIAARNCLVDESLGVRVSDFGLSRFLAHQKRSSPHSTAVSEIEEAQDEDAADGATTHSTVGPLRWLAPESVLHHAYSERSDSYAFGITMWEILCGSDPYPSHRALEAAIAASHDESFRPIVPVEWPAPIARLVRACWQHQAKARPTFSEILARLERMQAFLDEQLARWTPPPASHNNTSEEPAREARAAFAWSAACWAGFQD